MKYVAPIAQWKIDSDEERMLAEKADSNFAARRDYVAFYKKNDPVYFEKGLPLIEKTICEFLGGELTDQEKEWLTVDMIYSLHRFGCMFKEYFMFQFYKLNTIGREEFITDKKRYPFYTAFNTQENHELFTNKSKTYKVFAKYYKRDVLTIEKDSDFDKFQRFVKKHPKYMVKPLWGSLGQGIQIVDENSYEFFSGLLPKSGKEEYICEELIVQEAKMGIVHPASINTVRVPTVVCKDGVHIFHPVFRIGINNSIVDNGGSGGILANVDTDTGIVYTAGFDESGNRYVTHPNSGVSIVGFQIPRWSEAKSLAVELAQITDNRYAGWDLALTDNGWVMVEGNDCGEFIMQIADKVGRKKELDALISNI